MSSLVWKFFKKIDKVAVTCNLCGKKYKTSGNTTNLFAHLKLKHFYAYKSMQTKNKSKNASSENEVSLIDIDEVDHIEHEDVPGHGQDKENAQSQPTIKNMMEEMSSLKEGGQHYSNRLESLVYMICKDNLPFSCVEKSGLIRYTRSLCPKFKLPGRTKITELVESRFLTMKSILASKLSTMKHISLTSDILTLTNSSRSFIVATAHFIVPDSKSIERVTLTAQGLEEAHTGDSISSFFKDVLEEFSVLKCQILTITTDGGSNMKSAVELFLSGGRRIPCLAHLLNLVVDDSLKSNAELAKIISNVKQIVSYFKHSVRAMDALKKEQESEFDRKILILIQSVPTRWNSVLQMLERFIELSGVIAKVLALKHSAPDMIPASQMNILRDLVPLLVPFQQATTEISGENYVTSSLVIPIIHLLKSGLESRKSATAIGLYIQKQLLNGVEKRLTPLEKNSFLAIATILDPRFKKMHFESPFAVSNAISDLSAEITSQNNSRGRISSVNDAVLLEEGPCSFWSKHDQMLSSGSSATQEYSTPGIIPSELKQYLNMPLLPRSNDPLKYWFECQNFNPVLSDIAKKYLSFPASSVSSERVASAVNLAVPNNRSRLTGEHIKHRVFLTSLPDKYWG